MKSITPFLWFDDNAEEAARFYVSIFENSRIEAVTPMTVSFVLRGQRFIALNGGKQDFHFDESISFYVDCETQEEVDRLWTSLLAGGGRESRCGWLSDKYGVFWQIVPDALPRLLGDEDETRAERALHAMMGMAKIDIAALERAAAGPE